MIDSIDIPFFQGYSKNRTALGIKEGLVLIFIFLYISDLAATGCTTVTPPLVLLVGQLIDDTLVLLKLAVIYHRFLALLFTFVCGIALFGF